MQSENKFFDDIVKVLNGAAGTVAGMTREAETNFRERMREWMGSENMVTRDEFEAVKEMAATARDQCDALKARLDKLEGKPAASPRKGKGKGKGQGASPG